MPVGSWRAMNVPRGSDLLGQLCMKTGKSATDTFAIATPFLPEPKNIGECRSAVASQTSYTFVSMEKENIRKYCRVSLGCGVADLLYLLSGLPVKPSVDNPGKMTIVHGAIPHCGDQKVS